MDPNLLESLKRKRKQIADREGKALFMILHNSVLEETATLKPKIKEDFEKIKGWSKKKIEKYGPEFIEIITGQKAADVEGEGEKIYTVEGLLIFLNGKLSSLGRLRVRGEITEVNAHPNGYCFFMLKDSLTKDHSVTCYVSKYSYGAASHLLEVGMEVVVQASPSIYKTGLLASQWTKWRLLAKGRLRKPSIL